MKALMGEKKINGGKRRIENQENQLNEEGTLREQRYKSVKYGRD